MSNARTEFEKWAQFNFYPIAHEPNGVGLDGGPVYKDPRTHAAWCVYQWRQARGQAEPLTDERIVSIVCDGLQLTAEDGWLCYHWENSISSGGGEVLEIETAVKIARAIEREITTPTGEAS
jgi:hypothetical protein